MNGKVRVQKIEDRKAEGRTEGRETDRQRERGEREEGEEGWREAERGEREEREILQVTSSWLLMNIYAFKFILFRKT